MIARLTGLVEVLGDGSAVVEVGGVGYLVFCSSRTLTRLQGETATVRLHIETHVREDHIHLYGFLDQAEQKWFCLLTTVQGVGARVAMAILSALAADEILHAVASGDKNMVARANGVGPKLAARIVAELEDKIGGIALGPGVTTVTPVDGLSGPADDAISALVNLGYGRSEAYGAVARAGTRLGEQAPLAELIRSGLEELAQ